MTTLNSLLNACLRHRSLTHDLQQLDRQWTDCDFDRHMYVVLTDKRDHQRAVIDSYEQAQLNLDADQRS